MHNGNPRTGEKGEERIFEKIMAEISQKIKDMNLHRQKTRQTPGSTNAKKSTPRPTLTKLLEANDEEKTLKAAREKQLDQYKRPSVRVTENFSSETVKARKDWDAIVGGPKENCQPRVLHLANLPLEMKKKAGHPQTNKHEEVHWHQTCPSRNAKEVLRAEMKGYQTEK